MLLPLPHRADGFVVEVDGLAVCRPDFGGGGLRLGSVLRAGTARIAFGESAGAAFAIRPPPHS